MSISDLKLIWSGLTETLYMVSLSGAIAIFLGFPLGAILFFTKPKHLCEAPWFYRSISGLVNSTRSLPFIILMILLIPITRALVGSSIGIHAAIVPLSIGAIPLFARLVESNLSEVPSGLIDMSRSFGAKPSEVLSKILFPEALPSLIQSMTLLLVSLVGYSAMAGTMGGGGLGDLAVRYGYQRFEFKIMLATVVVLMTLVQIIQSSGDHISNTINKKARIKQ